MKKGLERENGIPYFYEREVWFCSIGINVGREQDSRNMKFSRPVIILKKFNESMFWGIPVTSTVKENKYSFVFRIQNQENSALISQFRIFDSKRLIRKSGVLDEKEFDVLKDRLVEIIKTKTPSSFR